MPRLIYVVYLDNRHTSPMGLKAFKWEQQAREYIENHKQEYAGRINIMVIPLED